LLARWSGALVLTVDYERLGVRPGDRVLDLGCGAGRHAYEAVRRGGTAVALDVDQPGLVAVSAMLAAVGADGAAQRADVGAPGVAEAQPSPDDGPSGAGGGVPGSGWAAAGDALSLPFPDACFDRAIAAEVLEHIPEDTVALEELARVVRPGGVLAVTVPRFGPEVVNWALSEAYHSVPGGHIRIYRRCQLERRIRDAGFAPFARHHAHALHSPYWWLRCLVGVDRDDQVLVRAYHRLLVWDIERAPVLTRRAEWALNPLLGKSLVVYAVRLPARAGRRGGEAVPARAPERRALGGAVPAGTPRQLEAAGSAVPVGAPGCPGA